MNAVEDQDGAAGSRVAKRMITSHLGANKKLNQGPKFEQGPKSKSNKGPDKGQKRPQTGDLRDLLAKKKAAKRGDGQKSGEKVMDRGTSSKGVGDKRTGVKVMDGGTFSKGVGDRSTGGTFVNHGPLYNCTFHIN